MRNKKFISFFQMIYTGRKGTTGAYMATLLVLLSAFAATGAEKTSTTGADPQALPIKASTKKKSEIIKKSPVDTKKILSGDFKVTNFVILNNTGLPDSAIYFNLLNTANTGTTNCPPIGDWNSLFQWYGGTVGTPGTPAKGIGRNGNDRNGNPAPTSNLSYNDTDNTPTSGWSGVTLAEMRGSVLSNASNITSAPTSSSPYWATAKYSDLVPNNPEPNITGTFPTISMGFFGACSPKADSAGRIAISAFQPFTNDKFSSFANTVSPYLLVEGMIFPTDDPNSPYPPQASNLDLSYVDQISIAANLELWTMKNGKFEEQRDGWLVGYSLKTAEDATYNIFANALASDGIQKVVFTPTPGNGNNYPRYFAFSHDMVSSYSCPYTTFLGKLITDTTESLNSSTPPPHPVVKVAGVNVNIGSAAGTFDALEFGDCNYGNQLGYDFATYFVDLSTTAPDQSQANWTKILSWYSTDSINAVHATPTDPTQYFSPNSTDDPKLNQYMLMLGTFLPGSDWSLSPYPFNVNTSAGNGPVSIQLSSYNQIGICGLTTSGAGNPPVSCLASDGLSQIQTMGLGTNQPLGGIFGSPTSGRTDTTLNVPLVGINFHVNGTTYLLKEFDLSVGKTEPGTGDLRVNLTNATSNVALVRVSIPIPQQTNGEGLASSVVGTNTWTSGFATDGANGWPLQIDWEKRTCTYHGTPLTPTFSYMPTGGTTESQWKVVTASNVQDYNEKRALNGVHGTATIPIPDTYRIDLSGDNLTVALTSGSPTAVKAPIISGTSANASLNYHCNGADYSHITDAGNPWLLNQIQISPTPTKATTSLHLLAVSQTDLLDPSGLSGNNVKYRCLRWNNDTLAWEEAFGSGDAGGWPTIPTTTTGSIGLCANTTSVGPPQSASLATATKGILNNISGKCIGDICAAFSFGMVNSIKPGSDFSGVYWPPYPFPPNSTFIGALTTGQYFQLLGSQTSNVGQLPVGVNNSLDNTTLRYDPYVSLGLNGAESNCYFSGFGDRCSTYGGVMNVNPTLSIDSTPFAPKLNLGNVPGIDPTNNTVIVITLHPILRPATTDTIDSDLDNDLDTDSHDIGLLLLAFGVCPPAPETCPEDLNKDGVVDNADLGSMLINFTN